MITVVPGLIKIGKTGLNNLESRMYSLELNGYSDVVGLKRKFAIEVEDYDEKETLLSDIFSKSRVPNTELFALDIDLVIQLLSSFDDATKDRQVKLDWSTIPNGEYYLSEYKNNFGEVKATMKGQDGVFTVLKGSICAPTKEIWLPESRKKHKLETIY